MKKNVLLAITLILFSHVTAVWALDFNPYASFRFQSGYYDAEDGYPGGTGVDGTIGKAGTDDKGMLLAFMADSRFGSNMKADQLSGNIEFGLKNSSRAKNAVNAIYLRKAYGTWGWGDFKILVGKTFTPATFLGYSRMNADIGNQGDDDLFSSGVPHINRQAQVRISYNGLEFAAIEQNKAVASLPSHAGKDIDFYFPRIEAAYKKTMGPVTMRPVFGYQEYKISDPGDSLSEQTIRSFLAGLGIKVKVDPVFAHLAVSFAQNGKNYGLQCNTITNFFSMPYSASEPVLDSDLWQGIFVLGYQSNPMARFEGGISYMKADGYDIDKGKGHQESWVFYLQTRVALASNIELIPEVGYVKVGDERFDSGLKVERGDLKYANLGMRLTF